MRNFKQDILKAVGGEKIVAVVIGYSGEERSDGKVIKWEQAESKFDYEYSTGYGVAGCQSVYIWTATKVFFVTEYDGATEIKFIPRNPIDILPEYDGSSIE